MFFSNWEAVGRAAAMAAMSYALLILILRVTGKRTTSKMNSFDWIVTVALGSMLSTVILIKDVKLAEGMAGIASLVILQFFVAFFASRSQAVQKVIKANPRLLYYGGEFLEPAMKNERISRAEILSAIRGDGYSSLDDVSAVVLETNAEISIIAKDDGDGAALGNVVRR